MILSTLSPLKVVYKLCAFVKWVCRVQFQKAFLYGELLLNEMWRKYVGGNYTSKNELTETLMDLFSRLQRSESVLSDAYHYNNLVRF